MSNPVSALIVWQRFVKPMLPFMAGLTLMYGTYGYGKHTAAAAHKAALTQLESQRQSELLAAERAYGLKLAEANRKWQNWQAFAGVLDSKLASANQTIDAQAAMLAKDIPHAIKRDEQSGTRCFSGLGPDSLRLYSRALGYDTGAGQGR